MILSSKGQPQGWLTQHLSQATQLDIATGFITEKGLSLVLKPLQKRLKNGTCQVRVLYGHLPSYSNYAHELHELNQLVNRYSGRLKIRRATANGSHLFHPKLYLFSDDQGNKNALVGSSNTTRAGLSQNLELNITSVNFAPLQAVFAGWWSTAKPLPVFPQPFTKGNIQSQIAGGLAAGLIVEWNVSTKGFSIPLPTESLAGLPLAPLNIGGFHLQTGVRLTLDIAPEGVIQRIAALQNWGNSRVRKITIRTPWGRFATQRAIRELRDLTEDIQTRLCSEQEWISKNLREVDSGFENRIQRDFRKLMTQLGKPDSPPEQFQPVLKAARHAREALTKSRLVLNARLRLAQAPALQQLQSRFPGLRQSLEDSHSADIKELVVNAASAPRRSLRKYHRPEVAQRLCLLPDFRLDTAATHDWGGLRKGLDKQQMGLFNQQSFTEIFQNLDRELEEIHQWSALPLSNVLQKYQDLLT
ncbi:MAG: HKD family nuclease [Myxococcota bacterium]|jgi:HKD family nuclease